MGTIKCGFWYSKFIITPAEFHDFLQLCNKLGFEFVVPCYGLPQHSIEQVLQEYSINYEKYTAEVKPEKVFHSFAYSET